MDVRWIATRWKRLAGGIGAIAFVVVAAMMVIRPDAEWAQVFVVASRQLLAGEDFYRAGSLYLYPPFGTILGLPFVPLPEWATRLAFYVVNVAAIGVLALVSWRLAGETALGDPTPDNRAAWTIAALGVVASVPYAWNTVLHQQADLLIDALVAAGMFAHWRGRSIAAGVLIGLGASIKGPPLLFLVYFLWRRDARATLALLATVAVAALLPDLVHRAPEGTWVAVWLKRYILPVADVNTTLGNWAGSASHNIYNQSLGGTIQRLVNTRFSLVDGQATITAVESMVPGRTMKVLTYGTMAAMGVATFAVSWIAARNRRAAGLGEAAERDARALELAIVPLMMLAFSLMSGLAHFPIVAPAAVLLAHRAIRTGDRVSAAALTVAVAVAIAVNKDLVGRVLYDFFLWSGIATAALFALWLGALAALLRPRGA